MTKIELKVETVTPMFLGGADQQPEFRPASLRGALRFWLRAALGGVLGDQYLDDLHRREALVFGEAERGSAIVLRTPDPPRTGIVQELNQQGIGYLWFSMKGRGQGPRQAISAGAAWRVFLQQRGSNPQLISRAAESFWLLAQLGSLGARSRRGAGSIQIKQEMNWPTDVPSPIVAATTPDALQTELAAGLRVIRNNLAQWMGATPAAVIMDSEYNVLHPNCCKIWVVNKTFRHWRDGLEAVGAAMQSFRSRFPLHRYSTVPNDYLNVKTAMQGGNLAQPVQRAAFGLPIVFYFSSLRGQRGTLEGDEHARRASPLWIRVTQLANGQFVVVITTFYARLLAAGERLKLKRQGPPARVSAPGWQALDLFLANLDTAVAPRLEVDYQ
jgi:CRISPR-associated protein Cmr1